MWFQNRRAKWRKREKALGRESPSSYISGKPHDHLMPNLSDLTGIPISVSQHHPSPASAAVAAAAAVSTADFFKLQALHALQLNNFLPPVAAQFQPKTPPVHHGHPFQSLFHPYIISPSLPLLTAPHPSVFPQISVSPSASPDAISSPSASPNISAPPTSFYNHAMVGFVNSVSDAHTALQSSSTVNATTPTSSSPSGEAPSENRGHSAELLRLKARQHQMMLDQLVSVSAASNQIPSFRQESVITNASK